MTADNPQAEVDFARALARGEVEAVRAFETRHRPLVGHALGVALRRWRPESPVHPDDLAQDFVGFLFTDGGRRLQSFQGRSPFTAWLYTVALRYFQRRLARVAPDRRADVEPEARAADDHDPERALLASEDAARVRAAVAELPPEDRLLLRLFYLEELNAAEVAAALGKGAGGVRMRKMRLLDRLRAVLGHGPTLAEEVAP